MKYLVLLLLIISLNIPISVKAQQCQGENPITMILKGYKTDYRLLAPNATFLIDMNEGVFSMNISLEKFKSLDSIDAKTFLESVFEEDFFQNLSYIGIIPVSKFDKESGKIQKFTISGNLVLGDIKSQVPMDLTLDYMDRDLIFSFVLTLTPKDLTMSIPDSYKSILTGNIELRTDNSKLIIPKY
ncbi:MAG TPA: hypothetical protein VK766_01585 [Cytophagaceae bacterium]|jgi:hypothetical protein|nr:hypothetical protein [Cytophagaceae bacterium]